MEAAGVVVEVGPGATGGLVAYAMVRGAYTERAAVPVDRLVRIPEGSASTRPQR
jgi:NADPH:quinone reductase-like Zn-dependent oxidoreductase